MNKYEFVYRAAAALLGAVTGYLYGGWSPLLKVLITFVIIDYVTGLLAASYTGALSSKVGFKGIAKKVMLFFVVAGAHLCDLAIGVDQVIMSAAIYFYIANELLSILENAGRTGLPVPDQIKNAVQILKRKGDQK
ncbi:phage holin family protein [Sporolactobacillus laevolacticus]|uniref:Holin n=1 Tax=Sporolactobacillus laevolacticus DSM 442 TaxID=1395513 RepID=V6J5L8_9BACL|nr:phage holin family protein [Sporolactobacillus laevolacticus]EST12034.1 hypothetical protein P343_07865 [Sporolactobacillus laevolacticus DSM 442]